MDILLIVNPISGDKNKSSFLIYAEPLLLRSSLSYLIYKTTGNKDCVEIEKLIRLNSPKKAIVIGGDGTLNMFLKPLVDHQLKVGFIPMGSANGMAAELELTDSPQVLFEALIKSDKVIYLDVLSINRNHLLLHFGDVGANANLVLNYDKDGSRGMFTYAKYFWSEFQNLKSFEIDIKTDSMEYERKGVMLAICNGRKFDTGIPLNSIGKMNDGLFELVVVKAVDFSDLITATLSKFDEDYTVQNFETIQAKTASIKLQHPRILQIDGEVIGEFQKLNIKVLSKALIFSNKKRQLVLKLTF